MFKRYQITIILCLSVILSTATSCLDLEPDSAINSVETDHTVTATFINEEVGNEPIINALVTFRVIEGPNEGLTSQPFSGQCNPDSCRTNELGQVSWTYSSDLVGIDVIVATSPIFILGEEIDVPSDTVIKIWQGQPRPIPTLSQWGLLAMAGILGLVAFIFIRRRQVSA